MQRSPASLALLLAPLAALNGCAGSGTQATGSGGAGGGAATTSSSADTTAQTTTASSSSGGTGGAPTTPMPVGCVTDVSAGHHVFPCAGGITYDVEIPAACAAGGCGLVLDMHGFTMNAAQEEAGTGMRLLGKQHGFVIVQPTAPGTPASWDQAAHVPLVFAFIGDAIAALSIDPARRHVMGFSQGGGMTWRMICAHADFWASAAPLAGIAGCEFSGPNAPAREVPTMMVHGHKDNIVSFNAIAAPQRDAALAFWKDGAGTKIAGDVGYTATRYLSPAGTPFELWEHDYTAGSVIIGGHCFPGGSDVGISPFQFGCQPPNSFVVGEQAMAFFLAHPMK